VEHRWGQRKSINASVQLRTQGGIVALGRLLNASLSGAFVQTPLRVPPLSRVLLIIPVESSHVTAQVEGLIVRHTDSGMGLEWSEFAGEKIVALLERRALAHPAHLQL
jgi:PilZ domain-containing protein